MGCDWRVWLVKKVNGVWTPATPAVDPYGEGEGWNTHSLQCFSGRDYKLFGYVGGVRSGSGPTEGRGWFRNVSPYLEKMMRHKDLHSHTWVSIDEMVAAFKECKVKLPEQELPILSVAYNGGNADMWGNDYRPAKRLIEMEEAEAEMLGAEKPEFLLFVAFDG